MAETNPDHSINQPQQQLYPQVGVHEVQNQDVILIEDTELLARLEEPDIPLRLGACRLAAPKYLFSVKDKIIEDAIEALRVEQDYRITHKDTAFMQARAKELRGNIDILNLYINYTRGYHDEGIPDSEEIKELLDERNALIALEKIEDTIILFVAETSRRHKLRFSQEPIDLQQLRAQKEYDENENY